MNNIAWKFRCSIKSNFVYLIYLQKQVCYFDVSIQFVFYAKAQDPNFIIEEYLYPHMLTFGTPKVNSSMPKY